MRLKNTILLALLLLSTHFLLAQATPIKLENPSFEDLPSAAHTPQSWLDCGFAGESPPDVHPNGNYGVTQKAKHRKTYLAMVTRDNGTWESVAQKLKTSLLADTCYKMSIYLAQSLTYMSRSQLTGREANYITPAKLRIWSGTTECGQEELVAGSPKITDEKWTEYTFILKPKKKALYIIFEAYYGDEIILRGNGNILLDNVSDIVPCGCSEPKY